MLEEEQKKETKIIIYSWNVPSGYLINAVKEEYNYFKKRGYRVEVIFYKTNVPNYYKNWIKQLDSTIIKKHGKPIKLFNFLAKDTATSGFEIPLDAFFTPSLLLLKEKSYVISHEMTSGLSLIFYAIFNPRKVSVVVHDDVFSFLSIKSSKEVALVTKLIGRIVKFMVNFFGVLFATNTKISLYLSRSIEGARVVSAELGINRCDIAPKITERREILVVSHWYRQRKPEIYLRVAQIVGKEYKFILAGHWDDKEYYSEIKNEVEEMNSNQSNVVLMPDLSEEELHKLYHGCRAFVRLGFGESGIGGGILDAIGHGCPLVIGKGLGGMEDIRNDVHGYLVDDEDPSEIGQKLLNIMKSDDLASFFSRNVFLIADKYSWERHGRILEDNILNNKWK